MDYNKIIYLLAVVFIVLLIACFAVFTTGFAKKDSAINVTSENTLNDGDYFSILLSDADGNPLANQVVNITIIDADGSENHQQVTTDESGKGMLQLNGLTPNEYTFSITYGGNGDYKGCNATAKVTIAAAQPASSSNSKSSAQPSDWYDSDGAHHYYENGKEYVGSREAQHFDIDTYNRVKEHGMG